MTDVETAYDPTNGVFNSLFATATTLYKEVDGRNRFPPVIPAIELSRDELEITTPPYEFMHNSENEGRLRAGNTNLPLPSAPLPRARAGHGWSGRKLRLDLPPASAGDGT